MRRFALPLVAVLLAVIGALAWYYVGGRETPAAKPATTVVEAAPNDKSIAVLPFADMSAGKDQEYFADGLSEELLNLLAKMPELRVIGRTSSFQFKGRNEDLRAIGEKLNVAHILEGSVRKSGVKLRITAQLIRAADGSHLWSESYDRTLDDIFVVQDEIAGEVVKALKLTLLGTTSVTRSRPVDPDAYNLVLQGRFFVDRFDQKESERAVELFEGQRARSGIRPSLGRPVAGIRESGCLRLRAGRGRLSTGTRGRGEGAGARPAARGRSSGNGFYNRHDWNWEAADTSFRQALDLEPGNAVTLRRRRQAYTLGRWNEAIDFAQEPSSAIRYGRQPTPTSAYFAGSRPRHRGRGRVSQGPRTRSRRSSTWH